VVGYCDGVSLMAFAVICDTASKVYLRGVVMVIVSYLVIGTVLAFLVGCAARIGRGEFVVMAVFWPVMAAI